MPLYICLLRAVNVGGTGKLPMADLRTMCEDAGFTEVRTYIASGNVVLRSAAGPQQVQATLEAALASYSRTPVAVLVRTPEEMRMVMAANPFSGCAPNRVLVTFLLGPAAPDALVNTSGRAGEELALGEREIYVHYPGGMGNSKLKIPAARPGTARNINTIAKLVEMAAG